MHSESRPIARPRQGAPHLGNVPRGVARPALSCASPPQRKGAGAPRRGPLGKGPYHACGALLSFYAHSVAIEADTYASQAFPFHGPHRGEVRSLSRKSRTRLLYFLARVAVPGACDPLWCTLTWHNDSAHTAEKPYDALHRWTAEIQKGIPEAHFVWRLEWQQRGMPHFHVVLWLPHRFAGGRFPHVIARLRQRWTELNEPGDAAAAEHAAKIEVIHGWRQMASYVAKYVAKDDLREMPTYSGRRWGHSAHIPRPCTMQLRLSLPGVYWLKRLFRRMFKAQARARGRKPYQPKGPGSAQFLCAPNDALHLCDLISMLSPGAVGYAEIAPEARQAADAPPTRYPHIARALQDSQLSLIPPRALVI